MKKWQIFLPHEEAKDNDEQSALPVILIFDVSVSYHSFNLLWLNKAPYILCDCTTVSLFFCLLLGDYINPLLTPQVSFRSYQP